MREELIEYLDILRNGEVDKVDYAFHFFLDDTSLSDEPQSALGVFLINTDEVNAVRKVVAALRGMLRRYGRNESDRTYVEAPEWRSVEVAAAAALVALQASTT